MLLKIMTCALLCYSFSALGEVINCEPSTAWGHAEWNDVHHVFELTVPNVNITIGENIPDWSVLYTASANIGYVDVKCNGSGIGMYYTLINQGDFVSRQGTDYIYSTNVPGVGVSVSSNQLGNTGLQPYPSVLYYSAVTSSYGFWATIKFWKIPGKIPMNNGALSVTGSDAAIVLMKSNATFTSSESDRITNDGRGYVTGSRILTATLLFQPGTCNVEGDDINVNIGNYDGSSNHSNWVDSSFKLICPNALGYSGGVNSGTNSTYPYNIDPNASVTKNNKQNGRVQITIEPYTEIIDANKGIIALDGTGAQGYGIQLAWGDYSSQNAADPANPVILNTPIDANKLNSAFLASDTPIGGNAFTGGDNTIKMAARYIRTTGETQPGPANAVVQVIANYQ
ncbi:fimbrial protein [Citrobacter amalonaticus]|uniref:fimbrial protein n=1 Tax=Citrobacter amalonaticus TaxID=35703 RepID=UPI00339C6D58